MLTVLIISLVTFVLGLFLLDEVINRYGSYVSNHDSVFGPIGIFMVVGGVIGVMVALHSFREERLKKEKQTKEKIEQRDNIKDIELIITDVNSDSTIVKCENVQIYGKFTSTIGDTLRIKFN